ncbi:MAG: glycoside hydrolase family 3 N-terminal domain-containing protein [Candidatus Neomarinimicrobiota bacterium]|nr:glycoside hydrolase family 3 N-terminal domain-containing protein [Candidatus Neomarinimicrobiota bacterium]
MHKLFFVIILFFSCSKSLDVDFPDTIENVKYDQLEWNEFSLKEKIGQMIMIRIRGDYYHADHWYRKKINKWLSKDAIGGVITFGGSIHGSYHNIDQFQNWSKFPLLVAADYERGLGQWMGGGTLFPTNMALAATSDYDFAYEQGKITALEARALGIHVTFSPVLDINNNPNNPIINFRSYGDDPNLVGDFGSSFIKGAQDHGVVACAKHFPGHGNTSIDSHSTLPIINGNRLELDNMELLPFKQAVDNGVGMIMVGHISLPGLDDSNRPASQSFEITTNLLRHEWGYNGIIITDGMEMGGLTESTWAGESAVRAIEAGSDILLLPIDVDQTINAVLEAVKDGRISENRINESVKRIWEMKNEMGLLDNKYQLPFDELENVIGIPKHQNMAQSIANKSITVVKDDNNQLPLYVENIDSLGHIILSMDDGARGYLKSFSRDLVKTHGHVKEILINNKTSDLARKDIINQMKGVDKLIVSLLVRIRMDKGISTIDSTHSILLSELRSLDVPIITFSFGSPYLPSYENIDTYVCTYGYGSISVRAASNALWGRNSITGKLPVKLTSKYSKGHGLVKKKRTEQWGGELNVDLSTSWAIIDSGIKNKIFPGAQVFISKKGEIIFNGGFGNYDYGANSTIVSNNSIYDIASITKVISITPIVMKLIEKKKISLDQPVYYFLPKFRGPLKDKVTIRHLLTHSSGINSYHRFFMEKENMYRSDIIQAIIKMDLQYEPGSQFSYSDLAIILLMEIVEKVSLKSIDRMASSWIFKPLGMTSTMYNPSQNLLSKIVPTEIDKIFRNKLIHGIVHDENTFLLGGVSSHAGLFSTAENLGRFAQMHLNNGTWLGKRIFKESSIKLFTSKQFMPYDSDYAIGWDTPSQNGKSSAGDYFSDLSYGHLGFTGTSMWVDSEKEIIIVLLTNRVHPSRDKEGIYGIRRRFHNATMKKLIEM